jgi:hypothetical protein
MTFKPTNSDFLPTRALVGLVITLACLLAVLLPAGASAAVTTIGSSLAVPATLNTAENLGYEGTYTAVPPAPDAPNGEFHTFHYGADTAIWNVSQPAGVSVVPATGQVLTVKLEGCAQQAEGGPAPLTEIHFQDLTPLPGGGAKVNISSQGFSIPVCGQGGAGPTTISTYEPINLCVSQGDYVGFNDDGGYVPNIYRAGVPYDVLGSVEGATAYSFLRDGGTGNGAVMSSSYKGANEGFASNANEELMMQETLGTGADATHICAGGTAGAPPVLAPIRVSPQTDGINHERIVAVAVFCRLAPQCRGVVTVTLPGGSGHTSSSPGGRTVGREGFVLPPHVTSHLAIRLSSSVMGLIRAHGLAAKLTAVVAGKTVTQTINVKIL